MIILGEWFDDDYVCLFIIGDDAFIDDPFLLYPDVVEYETEDDEE